MWRAPQPPLQLSKAMSRVNPDLIPANASVHHHATSHNHSRTLNSCLLPCCTQINGAFAILVFSIMSKSRGCRLGLEHSSLSLLFASSLHFSPEALHFVCQTSSDEHESHASTCICSLTLKQSSQGKQMITTGLFQSVLLVSRRRGSQVGGGDN